MKPRVCKKVLFNWPGELSIDQYTCTIHLNCCEESLKWILKVYMYLSLLLYTGRFSTINYHSIVSPLLPDLFYNISSKGGGEWGMKKRNIEEIYLCL